MGPRSIALNAAVQAADLARFRPEQATGEAGAVSDVSGAERAAPKAGGTGTSGSGGRERGSDKGQDGLTAAEREVVSDLRARDAEVRRHEEAHARVGGQYAGQPSYSYQTGPDGKRYAVGGEVAIDVSEVPGDPEATINKMVVVKRAALAPAEPSGQDRRVAAYADAQRLEAQAELNSQRLEEQAARLEETGPGRGEAAPAPTGIGGLAAALSRGPESDPGQVLARVR